ncbi:MAG: hypothetical protein DMG04_06875 [Acidobacteria bacterium]|nr:MAG: hypothetical protein DMG04_06875 [Acidobacteriota bacterium]
MNAGERGRLLLVAAGAFLLYTAGAGGAPVYLDPDEVMFALQAHSIAATAHDLDGRFLPLYFHMSLLGQNVWFHPVIVYCMAPFLKVLPLTDWTVRLPSAAVGAINVVLTYFIARRMFAAPRAALLAAALLALTPAHFIHSRLAMDYLYPVPFVLGWLLCLLIYFERRDACFAWPLTLLAVWAATHPAFVTATLERYRQPQPIDYLQGFKGLSLAAALEQARRLLAFSGVTGRISMYWYFFDPAYLFLYGGYTNVMNSTRHVGVFLAPLLVFVPVGIVAIATGRRTTLDLILLAGFLSAPFAACLVVPEPYAIDRELELLPFGVLIATRGVERLLAARARVYRAAAIVLLALVPLHFAFVLFDYFGDFRIRSAIWFSGNRRGALESIVARASRERVPAIYLSTRHVPYLDAYWQFYLIKQRRQDLLQRTIYFTEGTLDPSAVPAGSLVLASRDDRPLFALAESRGLRRIELVPEPDGTPLFAIFQR